MAIANLHETWLTYQLRKSQINLEMTAIQNQKTLAASSTADVQLLKSAETRATRNYFKDLYNDDKELQELYIDYTEIPDFEEEIEKINALYQQQLDDLAAWETVLDNQLTVLSTELEEIKAFEESNKSLLSANVTEDFSFGLTQG